MSYISFNVYFTEKGIAKLYKKICFLKEHIDDVEKLFIKNSLDYLEERAKYHLSTSVNSDFSTGELMDSFRKEYDLKRIINYCSYASYVEFGTGIVGKQNPHPNVPNGWVYDVNQHGEAGWVFPTKDGEFRWTQGQEPHRFMYNALVDYMMEYKKIYSDAFEKVMGKELRRN